MSVTSVTKGVMRYDKGLVGNEVEETEEGYIKGRAIVTRCGVFVYMNGDGTQRTELRHPDDVSEAESLESIKMIPVVDGHPKERLVNADNSKKLSVGYTGELVENEYPYVIANMVITDSETVKKIKSKQRNQLSLGYTVDLLPEVGTYNGEPYEFRQTNIRYNHLALVDEARAGPQARIALDGLDAENVEINQIGVNNMAAKKQRKVKIDDAELMVEEEVANSLEGHASEKADLERRIAELQAQLDRVSAERDSMSDSEKRNLLHDMPETDNTNANGKEVPERQLSDPSPPMHMENPIVNGPTNAHYPNNLPHVAKVDSADINALVQARVKLVMLGSKYLDKATVSRMDSLSDMDVKKKLIMNFQPNANLDGKSEVYINARFDAVCEQLPAEKVIAAPSRADGVRHVQADAADARSRMINRLKNGYKTLNVKG